MRIPAFGLILLAGLMAACGPTSTPSPTPTPSKTPTPVPDTQQVAVLKTGVGGYMLQAMPVALVQNNAKSHDAVQVKVHFVVTAGDGSTYPIDSSAVTIAPQQVMALAALCTDRCNGARSTTATVSVGSWQSATTAIATAGAAYACGGGCRGGGFGTVSGTASGNLAANATVYISAACQDGAGDITGGGSSTMLWPGGGSTSVQVGVLNSAPPASCQLYAATS